MPLTDTDQVLTTVRMGLIGKGIGLSRTPAMHIAEAEAQGMRCTYDLIDTDTPDYAGHTLRDLLNIAEDSGYAGLNITYPYKVEVIDHLDDLSDGARAVGAVNTVIFRNGKRTGHNTDASGFKTAFEMYLGDSAHDHVVLIGAGGAGVAVAHALARSGVKRLSIFDTDETRANDLSVQLHESQSDCLSETVSDLASFLRDTAPDGIVNATPMGMAKLPGTAVPAELHRNSTWVADIVYFPLETQLLKEARAAGCQTMPGSGMAVYQAVRAFELFTGRPADPSRMKATFDAFDTQPRSNAGS